MYLREVRGRDPLTGVYGRRNRDASDIQRTEEATMSHSLGELEEILQRVPDGVVVLVAGPKTHPNLERWRSSRGWSTSLPQEPPG